MTNEKRKMKKIVMRPPLLVYTIIAVLSVAMSSCMDDETFTTSPTDRLEFSADTIRLDTVFSRVPSSTRTFWVYNNNQKAVRCRTVRLDRGNQTGFRVNVNGIYLGETQGWQLSDEEILGGDSLRVYVEATTPYNGLDRPQKVSDKLVFTLESGTVQEVELEVWSWDADIVNGIRVSRDTVLNSSKPTVVHGDILVDEGATLTIPAGKTLYMHSGARIIVSGSLKCLGEPGNEVVLRGDRLDRMFDYLPYDGVSGQWGGIVFRESSYDNVVSYTDLHGAYDAVVCDSSDIDRTKLTMHHSSVHNNKGHGLYADNSRLTITNSVVSNCLGSCLYIAGGDISVNGCTLAQFYPFDANRGDALTFTDTIDTAKRTIRRLDVANSIITGYADDVIMAYLADTVAKPYRFSHCMLRTPIPSDTTCFKRIIWEDVEDTVIAGWKNFMKVDTDLLQYDFSLSMSSLAIDAADPSTSPSDDRNGTQRDSKPDMGCYEAIREE